MANYAELTVSIDSGETPIDFRAKVLETEKGAMAFKFGLSQRPKGMSVAVWQGMARRLNVTHIGGQDSYKENLDTFKIERSLGEEARTALVLWMKGVFDQMEKDRSAATLRAAEELEDQGIQELSCADLTPLDSIDQSLSA